MSSFGVGLGSSKKGGRVADSSMVTRNIKLVAQGQSDATYADNQKKNPFRLSTAILNGDAYAPASLARSNFAAGVTPYIFRQQALVDLFSTFNSAAWTLNNGALVQSTPDRIRLLSNTGAAVTSAFYNNAFINVSFPFTVTETFATFGDAGANTPADGFCLAFATLPGFLGGGGGALGMLEGGSPTVINAVGIALDPCQNYARIATNTNLNAYSSSSVALGQIATNIATLASTNFVKVSVAYDGSNTMTWSVSQGVNLVSSSQSGINLQTLLRSSNAYLGATAGSGGRFQTVDLRGTTYQTYA